MGSGASQHALPESMHELEKNEGLIAVKEVLGLTGDEDLVVFEAFADLDSNHDGHVSLNEFLAKHKREEDKITCDTFLWRFFRVMGENDSLDPLPFFVSLHQFLVDDEAATLKMCFRMFDKDHSDNLDLLEFEKMCRLAHPEMTKEQVDDKMVELNFAGGDGDSLDLGEVLYEKHRLAFRTLLWPIFQAAEELRAKIAGEAYWKKRRHHFHKYQALHPDFKSDLVELFHDKLSGKDRERLRKAQEYRVAKLQREEDHLAHKAAKAEAREERGKFEMRDTSLDWTMYDDPATGYPYWRAPASARVSSSSRGPSRGARAGAGTTTSRASRPGRSRPRSRPRARRPTRCAATPRWPPTAASSTPASGATPSSSGTARSKTRGSGPTRARPSAL